jgi:spore maturation protein CgeB
MKSCIDCVYCERELEPEENGTFKYHCKIYKHMGFDPIKITFAEKCKLWIPKQKNLKTQNKT